MLERICYRHDFRRFDLGKPWRFIGVRFPDLLFQIFCWKNEKKEYNIKKGEVLHDRGNQKSHFK